MLPAPVVTSQIQRLFMHGWKHTLIGQQCSPLETWLFYFMIKLSYSATLKGNCHEQFNLKKTAWTFQVWFKAASMQGKTARIWWGFGSERNKLQTKEQIPWTWPENLACCHKRIYVNACAAHDSFPLTTEQCCTTNAALLYWLNIIVGPLIKS